MSTACQPLPRSGRGFGISMSFALGLVMAITTLTSALAVPSAHASYGEEIDDDIGCALVWAYDDDLPCDPSTDCWASSVPSCAPWSFSWGGNGTTDGFRPCGGDLEALTAAGGVPIVAELHRVTNSCPKGTQQGAVAQNKGQLALGTVVLQQATTLKTQCGTPGEWRRESDTEPIVPASRWVFYRAEDEINGTIGGGMEGGALPRYGKCVGLDRSCKFTVKFTWDSAGHVTGSKRSCTETMVYP
jgi:hypothetical protein